MTDRIRRLAERTLRGEMYAAPVPTEYDRRDLFLPAPERDVKRICEYILNQEPKLTEDSAFTGFFNFDGSVPGDAFRRGGHRATAEALSAFYLKPIDCLSTMEWQHAVPDFSSVLNTGIAGIVARIDRSLAAHAGDNEAETFLRGLRRIAGALVGWAHKCADRASAAAAAADPERRSGLERLARTLRRVPEQPPQTFYEAVLAVCVCFSADPDGIGRPDVYFTPFYRRDLEAGRLTRGEAKDYLQELFLLLQAATSLRSRWFTRGAESHFCIGGYLPDGSDGFNEVSELIAESLIELPTYIPQLTFRWTSKTPRRALRFMMDCERRDPHKRVAFTNDDKRIRSYTETGGIPFEKAVGYTTVGCNEPAFCGGIAGSTSKGNALHCLDTLFHKTPERIAGAKTFDEFYAAFEDELCKDLAAILDYDDKYNRLRAQDINYVSCLFMNGCIERAKSLTQGGCETVIASPMLIGTTNVIDSLIVVRQFVFDEKRFTLPELIRALDADWKGFEDMRAVILKTASFFGNDDARSVDTARRYYDSLYRFYRGRRNVFGYPWFVGDLTGYNAHFQWFGAGMKASPDGRHAGEPLKFGFGQSEGKDRAGLTALLNSLAAADPHGIVCGSTVTNIFLDEKLVKDDENFEKTVALFETFFRKGGVHFQLTYVSKEDLLAARSHPERYGHLRVRVTGFSDYFVNLSEALQNDILTRTEKDA